MEAVEEQEMKEIDSERKVTDFLPNFLLPIFLQVTLTEEGKFYACNVSDGQMPPQIPPQVARLTLTKTCKSSSAVGSCAVGSNKTFIHAKASP